MAPHWEGIEKPENIRRGRSALQRRRDRTASAQTPHIRAERPATGIMFERLWPARSAGATQRLVAPSPFAWVGIERGVECLLRGHGTL